MAYAAIPSPAAGSGATDIRRRRYRSFLDGKPGMRRTLQIAPRRQDFYALRAAPDTGRAGNARWRKLVGRVLRPSKRILVHQRKRDWRGRSARAAAGRLSRKISPQQPARRIRAVLGPAGTSVPETAVGHAERRRWEQREHCLDRTPGRFKENRSAESGRFGGGQWHCVHRRSDGCEVSGFRCKNRRRVVVRRTGGHGSCDSRDLFREEERKTVRGDCRGRRRVFPRKDFGRTGGLRIAVRVGPFNGMALLDREVRLSVYIGRSLKAVAGVFGVVLALGPGQPALAQRNVVVVRPKEIEDVLVNPGM